CRSAAAAPSAPSASWNTIPPAHKKAALRARLFSCSRRRLVQPGADDVGSNGLQPWPVLHRLRTQQPEIATRLRQFAGMADQPLFQPADFGFQVELQAQHIAAMQKGLMTADIGRRQMARTLRNVELVAMPVQNRYAIQCSQRRLPAVCRQ